LNDAGRAVLAAIKGLVVEEPGVDILYDGADGSEPGAVFNALVADHGPDALAQAEPAVIGAVAAGIRQEGARLRRRRPRRGAAAREISPCR
jgi:hypothetical protein